MDLDVKDLSAQTDSGNATTFANAKRIYQEGGNSQSYAEVTVLLTASIAVGTKLTGENAAGQAITGTAFEAAAAGATKLKFLYTIGDTQLTYSTCKVGGLLNVTLTGCKYR